MYKLTPKMLKEFKSSLRKYHKLFDGGRCEGFQQQELIVKAIKTDARSNLEVFWKGKTHKDKPDIIIKTKEEEHLFKVRSGDEEEDKIIISGYRLGKHDGNFSSITQYLNSREENIIGITYDKEDGKTRSKHIYRLYYLNISKLKGITTNKWVKKSTSRSKNPTRIQTNSHNVEFSVHPSMSWQVWWSVPKDIFEEKQEVVIIELHSKWAKIGYILSLIINWILRKNV